MSMKNAPKIDFNAPLPEDNKSVPSNVAPAVAAFQQRVQNMKGSGVTLNINGRDIPFTLVTIEAGRVEKKTSVWSFNERDQSLLNESSLADLIPTFQSAGQQVPAIGRDSCGIIEIADGSRRRATAIITKTAYRVLVGEMTDEEMTWLTKIGNFYQPTSAFERGKRYARLLQTTFTGTGKMTKLAEAEGLDRKTITRCIDTARLPVAIIHCFAAPNDLTARSGQALAKLYDNHAEAMLSAAEAITERRKTESMDPEDVVSALKDACAPATPPTKQPPRKRDFAKGIQAIYDGSKVNISLNDAPTDLISKIETLLEEHAKKPQRVDVNKSVDHDLSELTDVISLISTSAAEIDYPISDVEKRNLIIQTRKIMSTEQDEGRRINLVSELILESYIN